VFCRFIAAVVIYAGLAVYLFLPHFKRFNGIQYLLPVNLCLACLGCYLLSRRWVGSYIGSIFAGAIYGFGPYMLGLVKYHPSVTLLAAAIPWLFCPAALMQNRKWHWMSVFLSTLPFVTIVLFFRVTEHQRIFPISIQTRVRLSDLFGLLAPLVAASRGRTLVGFYHVPVAWLIMGISLLLAAQRKGIIAVIVLGSVFALFAHQLLLFTKVSPIIWLTIPILCCSVLIGEGMQGFALASFSDRKWVLATVILMGVLTIVTFLIATRYLFLFAGLGNGAARLLIDTAKLYILGALAVGVIFLILCAKKRLGYLRWLIICSATVVDIFLSARFVIDRVFI